MDFLAVDSETDDQFISTYTTTSSGYPESIVSTDYQENLEQQLERRTQFQPCAVPIPNVLPFKNTEEFLKTLPKHEYLEVLAPIKHGIISTDTSFELTHALTKIPVKVTAQELLDNAVKVGIIEEEDPYTTCESLPDLEALRNKEVRFFEPMDTKAFRVFCVVLTAVFFGVIQALFIYGAVQGYDDRKTELTDCIIAITLTLSLVFSVTLSSILVTWQK